MVAMWSITWRDINMETGETVGRKIALILVKADGGLDQSDGDDAKDKLTHLGHTQKVKEATKLH